MKKQLAAAVLLITLSAGISSAEMLTPGKRCATAKSWTATAAAAWNYIVNLL